MLERVARYIYFAGTDRKVTIIEVGCAAHKQDLPPGIEPGLAAEDFYKPVAYSFPSGCHVCEVEIDPDTGQVVLATYAAVNDFGVVVNPMLLEGQVHGGVAQDIGQALIGSIASRSRLQPIADRHLYGLLHPACGRPSVLRMGAQRGALQD